MTRLLLSYTILTVLSCCSAKKIKDKHIEVVIKDAHSYKYDLVNETFTVFHVSKPESVIKFHLSDTDRSKIAARYYELSIDELDRMDKETRNSYMEDECLDMPTLYTMLYVKTKTGSQKIQIDTGCDDFYISNFRRANSVKVFINFIMDILHSRPEIKNAPMSDIMYM